MPKLKKPRVVEAATPELARPDWIVVALALVGLAVAGYLTALKLGGTQAFLCRGGGGCRSANRGYDGPSNGYFNIGFRVGLAPGQP